MTLKEDCNAHHISPGLRRKAVVLQHQALHFTFLHPPWCMALQGGKVSTVLPFLQVHKNYTFLCKKYFHLILIVCCHFGRQATVTIFYSASVSDSNIFDSYQQDLNVTYLPRQKSGFVPASASETYISCLTFAYCEDLELGTVVLYF